MDIYTFTKVQIIHEYDMMHVFVVVVHSPSLLSVGN